MISQLLKEPCFFGFIGAILSIFITLLDSYLFNEKKIKLFIVKYLFYHLLLLQLFYTL